MIYFIRCGRYVKIGHAHDPLKRLIALQIGSPEPLELIGAVEGGASAEGILHAHFKPYRVRGEWFLVCDEIKAFLASAERNLMAPSDIVATNRALAEQASTRAVRKGHGRSTGRKPTVLPAQALERLRKAGGQAEGNVRALGQLLGTKSKTTAHRLLHRMAEGGMINLSATNNGMRVALS